MTGQSKFHMKKALLFVMAALFLYNCGNKGNGQLIGVQDREDWYQEDPFGMLFIPPGAYTQGTSDQDVPYQHVNTPRTVTVQAFYMDETEITNNEYRQFVYWVRDSIAHVLLGEADDPQNLGYHYQSDRKTKEVIEFGNVLPYKLINWDEDIEWDKEEVQLILEDPNDGIFIAEHERFLKRKEIDPRKLVFVYEWIDFKAAAEKFTVDGKHYRGVGAFHTDRSRFIKKERINVYPDTLAWIHDFAYSYNEPLAKMYFWHPAYDHYPVVGVSWRQAKAFCVWRTNLMNSYLDERSQAYWNDFRLPSEAEWEWASRGGLDLNPFPWGGPYIRNSNGCFLANYKPLRGNYLDDGGITTLIVAHYAPNDFGLYDMAGNVAEWTNDAYDPSSYNFTHDLNPSFESNISLDAEPAKQQKVIRGGSWKDWGYFIRTDTRTYEYQDTAKCYIGFRCVQTYLGRSKGDGPNSSAIY